MVPTSAFAAVLFLAAIAAWLIAIGVRSRARDYLRLAAVLDAGLAVGVGLDVAPTAIAPLTGTLATVLMAVAVYASFRRPVRPVPASLMLATACAAAIGAAYSGEALPALAPQLAAVAVMLAIARRGLMRLRAPSILLAVGGLSRFAAACALVSKDEKAMVALLLFSAAGLLGVALAVARISDTFVKRHRQRRRDDAAIGRLR